MLSPHFVDVEVESQRDHLVCNVNFEIYWYHLEMCSKALIYDYYVSNRYFFLFTLTSIPGKCVKNFILGTSVLFSLKKLECFGHMVMG